ncbi:uncharacterized protein LOC114871813 isoform X1 [Osmia bicornis bicornis]|uniref:uncharacterized protein LOC114871813 isoform X1 n=1 Tax=Osmia bicornis bicornis TaxID=1437191 RepID=UPI0010F72053|nr:uncharacterized protein LOC114871813 isoform X1 [Osmia bicornis bicornis]
MDESTKAAGSEKKPSAYLKVTNYPSNGNDLAKIPKRKLSVFYRSFDLIAPSDQDKETETIEFRRTSSSPSVRIERSQDSENNEITQTSSYKKAFIDNCRSLMDSDKGLSNSSPDRLSEKCLNNNEISTPSASSTSFKLPQVREGTIVNNYNVITETAIGKHKLNNNGNRKSKSTVDSVAIDSSDCRPSTDVQSKKKQDNDERISSAINPVLENPPETHPARPRWSNTDLVKIKDSEYPRSFVNASSAGRLGKYTSVDAEMSSHEDSSNGSDSEDDSIGTRSSMQAASTRNDDKNEGSRSKKSSILSHTSACFSIGEPTGEPDSIDDRNTEKTEDLEEIDTKRAKRQRFFAVRRSLSEGDSERYHRARRHCRCIRQELFDEKEEFSAFPSFTDGRLRIMGLSNLKDADSLYRESLSENELELKYIAFSIGLSTDRITLHRRMALSLRQRDQSERNFTDEIQKMQEDIQELSPLCTDRDSIDRVEKVRRRLDTVARCAHGVSCAAETLGAVYQEHRISRAVFIADKYLQILRTRCENLAAEIMETKRILLKNNIVIEENSGEVGDDLPKIRYRNGVPFNNRTMIARRRASIATISRPLSSQDMTKEGPRQRNSVSGRMTLRRPSLCSETQSWESEKLNRTDSSNSVAELRDISEQTESRRNSAEENNNLLRNDQSDITDTINCNIITDVEAEDRMINKQNSFVESDVTKTVEEQLTLCIQMGELLPRNFETWGLMIWSLLVFVLGYYARQITSC